MGSPQLTIERLDIASATPVRVTENPDGGFVDAAHPVLVGPLGLQEDAPRLAFRLRIGPENPTPEDLALAWNGSPYLKNLSVWVERRELAALTVQLGFAASWDDRLTAPLATAPATPPSTPNAPTSFSLYDGSGPEPERLVAGYLLLKVQTTSTAYPAGLYDGDGSGAFWLGILGDCV